VQALIALKLITTYYTPESICWASEKIDIACKKNTMIDVQYLTKKPNIILIGPMGAGKTHVGQLLAKQLLWSFFDTDQLIITQTGSSIPQLFKSKGEPYFRKLETEVLTQKITHQHNMVLATGSGIVCHPANRHMLTQCGWVVYLQVSIKQQWQRLKNCTHRPLLLVKHPKKTLAQLNQKRHPLYQALANISYRTDDQTPEDIVNKIVAKQ